MFKKTPKVNNRAAKISAIITLAAGVLIFIVANGGIPMPWIAQTLGIAMVAYSIYVAAVYLLREHTFIVEENERDEENETYLFKINERKGKREMTVVRVRLDEIVSVRVVDKENKQTVAEERKSKKRFTYDAQFMPQKRLEFDILCEGESISVLTTYDEELVALLKSYGVAVK